MKKIIAWRCKSCNEFLDKKLCRDHTKETDHSDFEPLYESYGEKKETAGFQCIECDQIIPKGRCGVHRQKTGHKEFQTIYKNGE